MTWCALLLAVRLSDLGCVDSDGFRSVTNPPLASLACRMNEPDASTPLLLLRCSNTAFLTFDRNLVIDAHYTAALTLLIGAVPPTVAFVCTTQISGSAHTHTRIWNES